MAQIPPPASRPPSSLKEGRDPGRGLGKMNGEREEDRYSGPVWHIKRRVSAVCVTENWMVVYLGLAASLFAAINGGPLLAPSPTHRPTLMAASGTVLLS